VAVWYPSCSRRRNPPQTLRAARRIPRRRRVLLLQPIHRHWSRVQRWSHHEPHEPKSHAGTRARFRHRPQGLVGRRRAAPWRRTGLLHVVCDRASTACRNRIAGLVFNTDAVRGEIVTQLDHQVGREGAHAVQSFLMERVNDGRASWRPQWAASHSPSRLPAHSSSCRRR
jgi:hypothetical protein